MRTKIGSASRIATVFLLLNAPSVIAGNCNELENSTPRELVDYLKSDRDVPSCVELAIDRLGSLKDPDAVDLLIKHLDFLRVQARGEVVIASFHNYEWPAVTALSALGPRALPALEKVLQEVLINDAIFRNAVSAFIAINRDNPKGIAVFFERAYLGAEDQQVRDRLLWAYKTQVRFCEEMHKSECLAVANPSLTRLPDPIVPW